MKKTLLVSLMISAFSSSQAAEICGPQTDSFAFVIDASGSMMQTFEEAKDKANIEDDSPINDLKISEATKTLVEKVSEVIRRRQNGFEPLHRGTLC